MWTVVLFVNTMEVILTGAVITLKDATNTTNGTVQQEYVMTMRKKAGE
jgi:hypothetical protein